MAEWQQIHYREEPITAYIEGAPTEVVPLVYDTPPLFGVGVELPDGSIGAGGNNWPRDLFAAWRAATILKSYEGLVLPSLEHVYRMSSHMPGMSLHAHDAPDILSVVGRDRFDEIMEAQIPAFLVDLVLGLQRQQDAPDLFFITDEVRAGTITWQEQFEGFDIEDPDDVERKELAKLDFVRDNYDALASASTFMGLTPRTPGYDILEDYKNSITRRSPS
jgi:hypothetical protein